MKSPLEMFYHWEHTQGNRIYLRQAVNGKVVEYSWHAAAQQVRKMAAALIDMNLPPKSHIAIASKNCAHWLFADLAIWMSGHVSIPLYPNLNTSMVQQIIEHSEAKFVFLGKLDDKSSYLNAIPDGLPTVCFPYDAPNNLPDWDHFTKDHKPCTTPVERTFEETATIIYTSGTTGKPKGVMHTFGSISHASTVIVKDLGLDPDQRFFSYLPLAHVAERVLTEVLALYSGGSVAFAESLDTFTANLEEAQPTIFLGVPRIWEKFQSGVFSKLPERKLSFLLTLPIISSLIRKKIRKALGLNSARLCLTGAAPISKELLLWYQRLGIDIREAYGLTENLAFSHFNRDKTVKFGSVGTPWPTVDAQISSDGEITIKSPSLMQGYFKEPEKTAEVIQGGYLYTGDQGQIDSSGYLTITGRVKDLFKTSKGKYVAPTPIELKISSAGIVEQVCVVGSQLPQPIALLNLSDQGKNLSQSNVTEVLSKILDRLNAQLDPHEKLNRLVVIRDIWSVENEFLTPTMKLKRNKVEQHYKDLVLVWCKSKDKVIFA